MEYQKNQIVKAAIDDMSETGEGIGRINGYTLFIKDAVIGDVVEAKLIKVKKNYAFARMEKIITASPHRVEPKCPYHRQCGGCQLQALSYEEQLHYKQNKVVNHLIRIGGFSADSIKSIMEPIVGMSDLGYRNKAQFPVGTDRDGNLITGFYAGRTHAIIANTDCLLGSEVNKPILEAILAFMKREGIRAYDETSGKGLVRHILIRTGRVTKEVMVCLVINGNGIREEEKLVSELLKLDFGKEISVAAEQPAYKIAHISVCINKENTNVIMGNKIRVLYGLPYITDFLNGLEFHISPLSFYQVNPVQVEKLYGMALEFAELTGTETVWDLYCGIGTISLCMAKRAKQVCGVELVPQAIEDARDNAARNHIENAEFYVGRAEEVLPQFYEKKSREDGENRLLTPDVIVVDPPRKGCDTLCLDTMLQMQPQRIVYVSCDSATLARDLKYLCEGGYELKRVRAVDMFGMTVHCESICLLQRVGR